MWSYACQMNGQDSKLVLEIFNLIASRTNSISISYYSFKLLHKQTLSHRRFRCFTFESWMLHLWSKVKEEEIIVKLLCWILCFPLRDRGISSSLRCATKSSTANSIAYILAYYLNGISFLIIFRAIPEASYITLGTIRYGIKLANGINVARHSSASMDDNTKSASSGIVTPKRRQSSGPHSSLSETNGTSNQHERAKAKNPHMPIDSDEPASLSDVSSTSTACNNCHGYCCIDASKIQLPWTSSNRLNGTTKVINAEAG